MIFSILGFAGAFLILLAYFQVSRGTWKAGSRVFQACNALGALWLVAYGWHIEAWPNVLLNGVWLAVAIVTIGRMGRR